MSKDKLGRVYYTPTELCDMLYQTPNLNTGNLLLDDGGKFAKAVSQLHYEGCDPPAEYGVLPLSVEKFDAICQGEWYMPESYKSLDIAQWVLDQCKTDEELQRAAEELFVFQDRDLFPLLRFMKFFVDTLKEKKVIWGVGRGSSVASFVLYLIGVHRVNPIYYGLDSSEFFK